jgi:NitT/TauT family transport system permease protein
MERSTFTVTCLSLICILLLLPSILHALVVCYRTIDSSERMLLNFSYIPKASGQTTMSSQSENLNGIMSNSASISTNNKTNTHSQTIVSNKVDKSPIQKWSISLIDLLSDSISSVYRMFAALGLSFLVATIIGITAARKPLASKVIIPILDILQSVPILGFFPAAIAFFIAIFNGSPIGIELAAIFLIFTSMVWNMIFSVYESVLSIPSELLETTHVYRANPILQLRRLYLPASVPKLIYNSIVSWAGGWYFLTAAEIISLGSKTFTLQGLGSLLGNSVSSGQYIQALVALATLISIIMLTDFFFWRPLESYATRFKYDYSSSLDMDGPRHHHHFGLALRRAALSSIHLSHRSFRNPRPLLHLKSNRLMETLTKIAYGTELKVFPTIHEWFDNKRNVRTLEFIALPVLAALAILLIIFEGEVIYKSFSSLSNMYLSLYDDPRSVKIVSQIPLALLLSYLRLSAAYLITLAWTIPVAIRIAHNPRFDLIMPLFQTFAAIPATAFFPFVVILVNYIPGGFEFLSILLILTGMQWYVLFNLIGGVRSISGDIEETARAFRTTKALYIRRILFPSIYPSFITGSITGWGGGWNSLIVAEYLVFGNYKYSVLGMGSLLDKAAYDVGNTILLLLIVGVMSAVIVTINRLVWRRLHRKVIRKYSMSS